MENKLYTNSGMKVEFLPELNIVKTSYTAFVPDNLLKEGLLKVFEIAKANNCTKLIYDNSDFKGASSASQKWVNEEYPQLMNESGIRKCALIKAKDKFASFAVEKVIASVKASTPTEIFETIEDAIKWIKE